MHLSKFPVIRFEPGAQTESWLLLGFEELGER